MAGRIEDYGLIGDLLQVPQLREFAGDDVDPMAVANGGHSVGQARRIGAMLDDLGMVWFEEPVSSDDVEALALLRGVLLCDVAAGEYVADVREAARLIPAVDCLQLDVARCGGYTGWLRGGALALAAAVPELRNVEWFADRARLEPLLADGAPPVVEGALQVPDRPGHGMRPSAGAERWRAR